MECSEKNVLEALSKGAMDSIPLVSSIVVMLITFVGLIALGDASLSWCAIALMQVSKDQCPLCLFVWQMRFH